MSDFILTKVQIKPFTVPNGVYIKRGVPGLRQEGFKPLESIPLSELPTDTLLALCEQFKKDVFANAGKEIPQ